MMKGYFSRAEHTYEHIYEKEAVFLVVFFVEEWTDSLWVMLFPRLQNISFLLTVCQWNIIQQNYSKCAFKCVKL